MSGDPRGERLQIMLTKEELTAVDTWRFGRLCRAGPPRCANCCGVD